jgi:hypothetical protein
MANTYVYILYPPQSAMWRMVPQPFLALVVDSDQHGIKYRCKGFETPTLIPFQVGWLDLDHVTVAAHGMSHNLPCTIQLLAHSSWADATVGKDNISAQKGGWKIMSFRRAFGRLVFLCMFLQVIPFMVFLRKVHAHKHSGPHMRGRQPSGKPNYGCGVITIRHSRQCLNQRTDSVRDVADVCILPDT